MNQEQNANELNQTAAPAQEPAPEETKTVDVGEEMPVLIPDDYDTEEVDYSAGSAMRSVVSAKGPIQEVTPYKRPKLKGKEAIADFFYHHGLKVGVIAGLIILLGVAAIQSIPTKYDYVINVYANVSIGLHTNEDIADQLMPYAEDVDENGEIRISVLNYNRESTVDPYEAMVAYMMLDTEFGGEYNSFLICLDHSNYNYLVENLGEGIFEQYEDYPALISLKDSELITSAVYPPADEEAEYEVERTELFLALLSIPEKYKDNEKMVARHDAAREMLGRILEANPDLGTEE